MKWGNEYRAENVHSIERAHYSTVLIGINQSGTRLWSLVQFICSQWKKKGIPFTNILFASGSDPKCDKCVGKKCNHFLSIIFYRKNVCRPAHKDAYINVLWSHCVADDVISLGRENAYVHIKCLVWLRFYCEFYIQKFYLAHSGYFPIFCASESCSMWCVAGLLFILFISIHHHRKQDVENDLWNI